MESLLPAIEEGTESVEAGGSAAQPGDAAKFGSMWLDRWHLLSLDAPTVAVVWTSLVAHAVGVVLPWTDLVAMFLAVWVVYVADRLLDARALKREDDAGLELRHIFHHQHRIGFSLAMGLACAGLAALLPTMPGRELERYLLLGMALVGWFGIIHTARKPLPKEFIVGIFFAAAVYIPTVVRLSIPLVEILLPALILAAVCSLNCLFISAWECEAKEDAQAHKAARVAARAVVPAALGVVLLCGVGMGLREPGQVLLGAAGASGLLLLALHIARHRVARTSLRALADVALLTPLVAGLWLL